MEWDSIKQKWGEMTLRVRSPTLAANINTKTIKGTARAGSQTGSQTGNQPADTPHGPSGAPSANAPDERSTV